MSKMSSHDPFGHLKHKLWLKEGSRITLTSLRAGGVPHIVGKLSMKVTIFLETSSQSDIYT